MGFCAQRGGWNGGVASKLVILVQGERSERAGTMRVLLALVAEASFVDVLTAEGLTLIDRLPAAQRCLAGSTEALEKSASG